MNIQKGRFVQVQISTRLHRLLMRCSLTIVWNKGIIRTTAGSIWVASIST